MEAVATRWRQGGGDLINPHEATEEQIARVHDRAYIARIAATAGQAAALDPDTFTSPESYAIARLAAGAAVAGVEHVMAASRVAQGNLSAALALVRPPGHHAERSRAMGFCLFNNVAVAAAHARAAGAARAAIVDYDVHHGNGTQHAFDADPSVLYVSTHQYPYYPGTGAADETGIGSGAGATLNVPLEVGATSDDYRLVFDEVVLPALAGYKPDILIVSAGFDAHERDPLAGMRLTAPAFAAMTAALRRVAETYCGGRLVVVTEGGYDLRALGESLDAVVDVLAAPKAPAVEWPPDGRPSTRGADAVRAVRAARPTLG